MSKSGVRLLVAALVCSAPLTAAQAQSAPPSFAQCAICHATTAGAPAKIGPTLAGVAGKPAATRPGFAYSDAMKKSKIVWTDAQLNAYLTAPMTMVKGTKMAYPGQPNAANRTAIIAYMKTLK